ncbi:Voltage-gated Ion Channel (VIC) Superfamily [Thraustotheca clavata]|uniref:Voltage-gated Ion Channel (VIC) Superfamily n=1 Tax=Thraustotheca clavata TaxID=74557 RepID=A0A1V9YRU5_9STRA|nr:Voltage-gated Ion Channel (VIC) Superfamily [Thraustotheca clavata]
MCFDWWTPADAISDFMIFLDVWFILDMILRFRTGIVDCGTIIMNPSIISKHYIKSVWFYIDAFSSFPFEFIFSNDSTASVSTRHTVKLMKYFKVPKLLRLGRLLKNLNRYKGYNGIVTVFGSLIYVSHFTSCVWVLLVNPCPDGTIEPLCSNDQMLNLYLIAYQISIASLTGGTMDVLQSTTTVLGGSYKSKNPAPSLYVWSIIMQPLGAIFLALIFGNVIALVQSVNRNGNAFRKKMDQVYHEMDSLNLPKSLRNRNLSDEMTLLKDRVMSLPLRHQIAICLYKEQLIKIPFFQHATDDVLGMICMLLRQVIYMPNDYIFKEGEIGKELYMIVKGCVEVLPTESPHEGSNPKTQDTVLLADGDFFGEIGIVMEVYRTRSVRATTMAELCILTKDGFNSILGDFPEFANEMKKLVIKRITLLYGDENMSPETLSRITDIAEHNLQKRIKAYASTRRYMQRQTELALGTRDKRNLLHRLQSPVAKTLDIDMNDEEKDSSDDESGSSESEVDDKLLASKVWLIARQLKKLKLEAAQQTKAMQSNMNAIGNTLTSIQEQLQELRASK